MNNKLPKIQTGDTNIDRIFASFINGKVLSKRDNDLKERLLIVWTLKLKNPTTERAVNAYKDAVGLDRAQFFRDAKKADSLFGNLLETERKAKKALYSEYVLEFLATCNEKEDRDNAAKALKLLGDTWEVNTSDSLTHNPAKLEDKPIKLSISKESAELLAATLSTGVADFNKIIDAEAEIVK